MSATSTPVAPLHRTRAASIVGIAKSEYTKLISLRSTTWSLALLVLITVGFTGFFMWFTVAYWDRMDPISRSQVLADPGRQILGAGFQLGQLAVCVLGVLVITSEYASGTIRASLLAVPSRIPVLIAKSAVFVVLVFVVGEIAAFPTFFLGSAILRSQVSVALSDPGVLRAVIGVGLYLALLGVMSIAVGAIVRHTAGAITGVIGFVLVLAPLAQLLPGTVGKHIAAYLPSQAGSMIASPRQAPSDLLSPWEGFTVGVIWTALLIVLAAYLLRRRDA
ncbi:ABC transporter transmembrane protein [Rhodococcus sp. B7740]|uniref:ABC transporter permease subunit n=1 Tax=Rhodococcus sp. B7740 TaxID=1564114 RepID=UPI0005D79D4D|nr:ABC transporter permease subunit [Rhodococcus sp. B7740]AJW40942.1 ABC transporter transmembrane protein [Rhodococcus sp. B7740]